MPPAPEAVGETPRSARTDAEQEDERAEEEGEKVDRSERGGQHEQAAASADQVGDPPPGRSGVDANERSGEDGTGEEEEMRREGEGRAV